MPPPPDKNMEAHAPATAGFSPEETELLKKFLANYKAGYYPINEDHSETPEEKKAREEEERVKAEAELYEAYTKNPDTRNIPPEQGKWSTAYGPAEIVSEQKPVSVEFGPAQIMEQYAPTNAGSRQPGYGRIGRTR